MHSERVTYLSTSDQKAALEAFAAARGESVGNVVREAVADFMEQPSKEELDEFAAIVKEVAAAVTNMRASLRRSIETIEKSQADVHRKMREAGLWE